MVDLGLEPAVRGLAATADQVPVAEVAAGLAVVEISTQG
jgi:hypothetical protein